MIHIFDPTINVLLAPLIKIVQDAHPRNISFPSVYILPEMPEDEHKEFQEWLNINFKEGKKLGIVEIPPFNLFDILGTYEYDGDKITIYKDVIEKIAGLLTISEEDLFKIVLLHEYAHWYSKWASMVAFSDGQWKKEDYKKAGEHLKEFLAQTIAYCALKEQDSTQKLASIFVDFSKQQPEYYKDFEQGSNLAELTKWLEINSKENLDVLGFKILMKDEDNNIVDMLV